MGTARSIQTKYNGYHFRSMLEARWAVYLEEMGIEFLYEPQGYTLSDGSNYLPDFYLPDYQCFAEVKGGPLDKFDFDRARQLVKDTNIPLILLNKDPKLSSYQMIVADENGPNGIRFEDINLCNHPKRPEKDEFIKNVFLENERMFKEAGLTNAISAVNKARSERFGT